LCIFWLPGIASRDAEANPETANLQYPFLVSAYVLFTPFFVALYQAFRLLTCIDRNKAFSELTVRALRYIKYCAITISILFVLGIIFVVIFIEGDRTGVIMLGLMGTFASSVIATFTAVLQKLLKEAINIKSENELTV
jgi:hypothetical protein